MPVYMPCLAENECEKSHRSNSGWPKGPFVKSEQSSRGGFAFFLKSAKACGYETIPLRSPVGCLRCDERLRSGDSAERIRRSERRAGAVPAAHGCADEHADSATSRQARVGRQGRELAACRLCAARAQAG